jgi:hypothetical protein
MVDANVDNLRQLDLAKLPLYSVNVKDQFTAEQWIEHIFHSRMASAWTADQTMAFVFKWVVKAADDLEALAGAAFPLPNPLFPEQFTVIAGFAALAVPVRAA